ncbi:MAG TPA: metal ABC transporter substrate-binding protein, partial [bacterium]|nr:metal ABC transporter substrate-binding protein [bacterium]
VVYHNSWPYFTERFGLVTTGYLESKPGIPPTPRHIEELVRTMKSKGTKVIIKEAFYENRTPKKIAKETGAAIAALATETEEGQGDYFSLFDENTLRLADAFSKAAK